MLQDDAVTEDAALRPEDAVVVDAAVLQEDVVVDAVVRPDDAVVVPSAETYVGRWRAVRYRSGGDASPIEYTDTPREQGPSALRVNGVLLVSANRLLYNVGMFRSDGFFAHLDDHLPSDYLWLHQIRRAEGRLIPQEDGFSFEERNRPELAPQRFVLGSDGLLWMHVRDWRGGSGTFSLAFARDPMPVQRDRLDISVPLRWGGQEAPPDNLAPVLFWDAPGAGFLEQRLTAAPWMGAPGARETSFNLSLVGPPAAMFQGRVGGIPVAVAFPTAYADTDGNNRYTTADGAHLQPPLTIVWRGEGPAEALVGTAFEGILPGYSLAFPHMIHISAPSTPIRLAPFDNTHLQGLSLWADSLELNPDLIVRLSEVLP